LEPPEFETVVATLGVRPTTTVIAAVFVLVEKQIDLILEQTVDHFALIGH